MYKMIATTNESGLLSTELVSWLSETGDSEYMDDTVIEELNEVELLMKELIWQMRNTMRMLSMYHDSISKKRLCQVKHSSPIFSLISTTYTPFH